MLEPELGLAAGAELLDVLVLLSPADFDSVAAGFDSAELDDSEGGLSPPELEDDFEA